MNTKHYTQHPFGNKLSCAFLLVLMFLATSFSYADDISKEQALQIASRFVKNSYNQSSVRRAPAKNLTPTLAYTQHSQVTSEKDNVYVVNLGNDQGFVVVSGESGVEDEVLGYCDHGKFIYDSCPVQLKDLLVSYSVTIDALRQNPALAAPGKAIVSWPSYIGNIVVGPLLTTTWNQWGPYNSYCPEGCPSGCVPTAIAQVMNYWQWPKESIGKVKNEDFSGHVYDWDNMLDNYGASNTTGGTLGEFTSYNKDQADAVGKLMADIGKAFGTTYSPEGSPTYFFVQPLIDNFGYEPGIESQKGLTAADLQESMKKELDARRPILYAGYPNYENGGEGDGHALVCDGYTDQDYFHFNYGWGGSYDGFYKNALIPRYQCAATIYTGVRPYDAVRKVIDGIEYGLLKNGTAEILDYTLGKSGQENGELTIPSVVKDDAGNEYKVTRILKNSFYNKGHFSKMTLGDNIEAIERFSFIYTNIDDLVLSDKMEAVPDEAFQTSKIKSLTIGANVKRIGKKAFSMTGLSKVTSKSPAFEVDDRAFSFCSNIDEGDWLDCITKIGEEAFAVVYFNTQPAFKNLETVGSRAFVSCTFPNNTFVVPSKLKSISPDAFDMTSVSFFIVKDNPNFLCSPYNQSCLCNSNGTSMLMTTNHPSGTVGDPNIDPFPESLVKMEPGSVRSEARVDIPNTIVEMEGAFKECTKISILYCYAVVPPVITDSTFNDKIFEDYPWLYVPKGTAELYANAPGWRRFEVINDELEYVPAPAQARQYYMVVDATDENQKRVSIPVNEVSSMQVSDDGQSVIIKRNGKEDVMLPVAAVDSISWMNGFVYENAEVFDMNVENLTVEAQKCQVQFSSSCFDEDVQLCIRNSVLKPNVDEAVTRGFVVDLSLSNDEHELNGTAQIVIPVSPAENEQVNAAYYNRETGEWEPVCFTYDEANGTVTILTNHLSEYSVFYSLLLDSRPLLRMPTYSLAPVLYTYDEATKVLFDIISSDDPDAQMAMQFKDEYSFMQSISLDGMYNILSGITDPFIQFKPEAIGNISDALGYVGTALTIVDLLAADIKGDDIGKTKAALQSILGYAGGQMASAIGTPIMSAAMGCAAFIGIALEKFGTTLQEHRYDVFRQAYKYYYSKEAQNRIGGRSKYKGDKDKYPHDYFRTTKDWYNYLYPIFAQGKMTQTKMESFIEYAVKEYTERFWNEDPEIIQLDCLGFVSGKVMSTYPEIYEYEKEKISEEYFAELMNGEMVSVIEAIKQNLYVEANNRYKAAYAQLANIFNTQYRLAISDSSRPENGKSQYAGWTMRFSDLPNNVDNPKDWECAIGDDGTASLGPVTIFSLLHNEIPFKVVLCDLDGVEKKSWSFTISEKTGKRLGKIDLATGGVQVEAPKLNNLQLTYDPSIVAMPLTLDGYVYDYGYDSEVVKKPYTGDTAPECRLDNTFNKRARFQTEIEKFFNRHDFVTIDLAGNIKIGDDIVGKMTGNEGTGKFTINTTHQFVDKTKEEFVQGVNNLFGGQGSVLGLVNLLNGTIAHKIDCEFTLVRNDDGGYTITYTGIGTYTFEAEVVSLIENWNYTAFQNSENQKITVEDISTGIVNGEGGVSLNYTVTLNPTE